MSRDNKPIQCELLHRGECSCWVGRLYNQTKEHQNQYHRIQLQMQAVEKEVAAMKEFRNLKGFAVVHQPFSTALSVGLLWYFRLLSYSLYSISYQPKIMITISHCWRLTAFTWVKRAIGKIVWNIKTTKTINYFKLTYIISWAGVSLWNNMLQPPSNKTLNWVSPQKRFLCPTKEYPFIFTNDNFNPVLTEGWRNNFT